MASKQPAALSVRLTDKQLVVLARGLCQSMFDMVVNGKAHAATAVPLTAARADLPAIGAEYQGGIYAGLTIHDNQPAALILLPGDEKMTWSDGVAWAEKKGSALPSRFDQLVLFKNLKKEFQDAWYWSGEQYASGSGCAWGQGFPYGYQFNYHESVTYRVRAVRRSVIQ